MKTQTTFTGKPCRNCSATLRYQSGTKQCVACKEAGRKRWREANPYSTRKRAPYDPEKMKRYNRAAKIKRKYGMSLDEFHGMYLEQLGLCAICNEPSQERMLSVDHDHSTGAVRELLCSECNLGLGNFADNTARLQSAIAYLARHERAAEIQRG